MWFQITKDEKEKLQPHCIHDPSYLYFFKIKGFMKT